MRRTVGNMTVYDDQTRAFGFLMRCLKSAAKHLQVVGIANPLHIPMQRHEASRHIFTEGQRRIAFNRDVVVVVNPDEFVQSKVTG